MAQQCTFKEIILMKGPYWFIYFLFIECCLSELPQRQSSL